MKWKAELEYFRGLPVRVAITLATHSRMHVAVTITTHYPPCLESDVGGEAGHND